jgi:pSer/pThr/pTyr-binding forkhead associated (FHA) protein
VSELALTLIRLGFLALLWAFVMITVLVLRRDLKQPADARPMATRSTRGARQPKAPRAEKVKAPKASKVKGTKLVVTEGPLAGTVVPLDTAQVTIGRAPDSTIVIDDDYASSRHARVYSSEGTWVVEDLGSTNGTWIERTRITTPTVLPVGAPLRVGRTTLQLQK